MKAHPLVVTIVTACTPSTAPRNPVVEHADPIACPEARLRALAAHFPEATLEIKIQRKEFETRGIVELPCPPGETDDACLTRARRQIPPGMIEEVFANGAGHVDGESEWEVTLELDGRTHTQRFSQPESPQILEEIYKTIGYQRVKVVSQCRIPTPDKREAVVWYGHQRPHRTATLTFPPTERDLELERIVAFERELHLHDDGNHGEYAPDDAHIRWFVDFSCE